MTESLKDLNLTKDEVSRLQKAFKDPEFCKMFSEYAQEISDPINRKRYEDEIKMAESERGMDTEFINPTPNYVLKSRNWPSLSSNVNGCAPLRQKMTLTEGQKVFINICSSEKIGKPEMNNGPNANGDGDKRGLHWSIPHSFSPPQEDLDKSHNMCIVCDVVFHPESVTLAANSPILRRLLESTAIEGVKRNFNLFFGLTKEYAESVWSESQVDSPERQIRLLRCVRTLKGVKRKGALRPTIIRRKRPDFEKCQERCRDEENAVFEAARRGPHPKESLAALTKLKKCSRGILEDPASSGSNESDPKYKLPEYKITHSTEFSIQNYRNAPDVMPPSRPDSLKLEIMLPGLCSADCLDLDVTDRKLHLQSEKPVAYRFDFDLPYPVDPEKGKAKFDKQLCKLCLTMPVIPSKAVEEVPLKGTDSIGGNKPFAVLSTSPEKQLSPRSPERVDSPGTSRFQVTSCESASEAPQLCHVREKENRKKRKRCKKKSKSDCPLASTFEASTAEIPLPSTPTVDFPTDSSVSHSAQNLSYPISCLITQDGFPTSCSLKPTRVPTLQLFVEKSFSYAPVRFRQDPSSFTVLLEIKNVIPDSLRLLWSADERTTCKDENTNSAPPLRLLITCTSRGGGACTVNWGVVLHCPSEGVATSLQDNSDDEDAFSEKILKNHRGLASTSQSDVSSCGRPDIICCDITSKNVSLVISKPKSADNQLDPSLPWWESVAIGRTMGPGLQKVPVVGLYPASLYAPDSSLTDASSTEHLPSSFRLLSKSPNQLIFHSKDPSLPDLSTAAHFPQTSSDAGLRFETFESHPLKGILKQRSTSECSIDEFHQHFGTCGIGLDPQFSSGEFPSASSSESEHAAIPESSVSTVDGLSLSPLDPAIAFASCRPQPVLTRRRICSVNFTMKPEKVAFSQYDSVETLRTLLKHRQKNIKRSERRRRYNSYTAPSVLINELNSCDNAINPPVSNYKQNRQQRRKEKFMLKMRKQQNVSPSDHFQPDGEVPASNLEESNRTTNSVSRASVVPIDSGEMMTSPPCSSKASEPSSSNQMPAPELPGSEGHIVSSKDSPKSKNVFDSPKKINSETSEFLKPHVTNCPVALTANVIFELDDDY